jgi:tRNA(Ile)-lysidine synthase
MKQRVPEELRMQDRFSRYIAENKLVQAGDRLLLAVSGGIDSMVMTKLFLQAGLQTGIAHCNFSLRGTESDKDEELVRLFASENNMQFHSVRFSTKSYASAKRISVQMAARELRYKWFEEIRAEYGYQKIAIAHNLNDNIETMLINLIRGTGITGLAGIRPSAGSIIRPLMFATRDEIELYARQNDVRYREDKSNADTKYTRNKIRHLVIPVLKEINPSLENTLSETAERFSGIDEVLNSYLRTITEAVVSVRGESTYFNLRLLKDYLAQKAVIFELFSPYGVTNAMLNDLIAVISGKTGGIILTDSHRIIRNRDELIVTKPEPGGKQHYIVNDTGGFLNVPFILSAGVFQTDAEFVITNDPLTACIDAEKLKFPLIIRNWKDGDRFYPFGMKQKKKLSDYFIDRKFSAIDKENTLLLESDGKIVWIIGERLDDRFRVTEETRKVLILKTKDKSIKTKVEGHPPTP